MNRKDNFLNALHFELLSYTTYNNSFMFFLIRFFFFKLNFLEKKERDRGLGSGAERSGYQPSLPLLVLTVDAQTSYCTALRCSFLSCRRQCQLSYRAVTGRARAFDFPAASVDPGYLHGVGSD